WRSGGRRRWPQGCRCRGGQAPQHRAPRDRRRIVRHAVLLWKRVQAEYYLSPVPPGAVPPGAPSPAAVSGGVGQTHGLLRPLRREDRLQEVGAGGLALEVGVALAAVVVDLQDAEIVSL